MKRSITIVFLIVLIGVISSLLVIGSKTIEEDKKPSVSEKNEFEGNDLLEDSKEKNSNEQNNASAREENVVRIENVNEVEVISVANTESEIVNGDNIPVILRFPRRNIEAPIVPVGINDFGEMEVINDSVHVSWYQFGHIPGGDGNAILSSHLDWKGKYGPLADLKRYPKGEILEIEFKDGSIKKFKLEQSNTYPVNFVPDSLMNVNGEERTTLITCSGAFKDGHYQDRVISIFKQIH